MTVQSLDENYWKEEFTKRIKNDRQEAEIQQSWLSVSEKESIWITTENIIEVRLEHLRKILSTINNLSLTSKDKEMIIGLSEKIYSDAIAKIIVQGK